MKISWIKLEIELFDNKKIKKIRRMPDGDKILLVWIYLLIEAGKCNAGGMIFISEKVPLNMDDIAKDLNFEISVIQLGIKTFLRLDMIIMDEKEFLYISDWENHQNIEGMEKAKLLRKERNKRYYEKKQIESLDNKTTSKTLQGATDKTRLDKTRLDKTIKDKNKYRDNISLTLIEYEKLLKKYGETQLDLILDKLDNYKGSKGKKYKSDYRAILLWVVEAVKAEPLKNDGGMCEAEKEYFRNLEKEKLNV